MAYFISTIPTPLLSTPDFSAVFGGAHGTLPFDAENLVRALEMIAFPETVFEVVQSHGEFILEVQTAEYPSLYPLYVDKRFGKKAKHRPPPRSKTLPEASVLLDRMKNLIGRPYIWGGNYACGIHEILTHYPAPKHKTLSALETSSWTFQGVDCSGLLYEASEGALPRNTQDLLFVGKSVPITHLSWDELPGVLEPLDLLIWKGHMTIVFDDKRVIESKHEWGGVTMTDLKKRLKYLRTVDKKKGAEDPIQVLQNPDTFLVRRFIT